MRFWDAVRQNLGLKALSLFLAVMLWLFVAAGRDAEVSRSVLVQLEHVPSGLVVAGNPPSTINVRIKGPKILLLKNRMGKLTLLLNLKDSNEGMTAFPSPGALINLPEGVRVTRVTPALIEIRLAKAGNSGNGK